LLLVLVVLLPVQVWTGFLAHGSTIDPDRMKLVWESIDGASGRA